MFNNIQHLNTFYIILSCYLSTLILLFVFFDRHARQTKFFYIKNFMIIGFLLVFLSGLPLGFMFFAKTYLWYSTSSSKLYISVFTMVLSNSFFLFFFLRTFYYEFMSSRKYIIKPSTGIFTSDYFLHSLCITIIGLHGFSIFYFNYFLLVL